MTNANQPTSDETERFVQQLAANQNRLYAYIYSLVGDHNRAADILQESNLVLWRKNHEFVEDRPFLPWAFAFARNQVMANIRDKGRDRCLLDVELVESLSTESEQQATQFDATRAALRHCLQQLTPTNKSLIQHRYDDGMSIAEVAESVGRGVGATKVALLRVRRQLAECISRRISLEAT